MPLTFTLHNRDKINRHFLYQNKACGKVRFSEISAKVVRQNIVQIEYKKTDFFKIVALIPTSIHGDFPRKHPSKLTKVNSNRNPPSTPLCSWLSIYSKIRFYQCFVEVANKKKSVGSQLDMHVINYARTIS